MKKPVMRTINILLTIIFSVTVLTACGSKEDNKDDREVSSNQAVTTYTTETWSKEIYAEEENKDLLLEANLQYVVFSGGDEKVTEKFNDFIQQKKQEFEEETERGAKYAKELYIVNAGQFQPWYNNAVWEVALLDDQYLSLVNTNESYMGGAHGGYATYGYVFDMKTGEQVKITDFIAQSGSNMEALYDNLIHQIEDLQQEKEIVFWDDYKDIVRKEVAVDGLWYLTETDLVIVANVYVLSSFASGDFTFEIPLSELPNMQ